MSSKRYSVESVNLQKVCTAQLYSNQCMRTHVVLAGESRKTLASLLDGLLHASDRGRNCSANVDCWALMSGLHAPTLSTPLLLQDVYGAQLDKLMHNGGWIPTTRFNVW